jgi:hypothetical protein
MTEGDIEMLAENRKGTSLLGNIPTLEVDKKKWTIKSLDVKMWTGFIWFMVESIGRRLTTR